MIKMFIGNEEVVSNHEFTIKEEMLSASSTILNNCYPKSWELTKDYVSNFYYPKDYSKFLLGEGEFEHGDEEYGVLNVSGETFMQYETNIEKEWNSFNIYGRTTQASTPTPDNPSELVSVGYENLLKNTATTQTINGITFTINENGTITANGTATANSQLLLTRENNEYGNMYLSGCPNGDGSNYFINLSYLNENNVWQREQHEIGNGLLITNSYPKIAVSLYIKSGFSCNNLIFKPMISKQLHNYIPYGKYGIEVKTIGKNLLKLNVVSGTYNEITLTRIDDNTFKVQGTTTGANRSIPITTIFPKLNEGEKYTYSVEILEGTFNGSLPIAIYNPDNTIRYNYFNLTSSNLAQTNTVIANNGIQGMSYYISNNTTVNATLRVMLEKSPSKTEYEPYKEKKNIYQLDEPLRANGDTKDLLYIKNGMLYVERKIGSVVLDGSESGWNTFRDNSNHYNYWIHRDDIAKTVISCLSNYFKYKTSGNNSIGEFQIGGNNPNKNGNIVINPFNDTTNNLTQFKTWLSTHNTEVQYVLAEPYKEVIGQFDVPYSYEGINNTTFGTGIDTEETIYYYWKNFNVLFAGIVKNSGDISLNPRYPHYCSLQILDYKTFLSESNTLDFVIANKTVKEAINMVVNAVKNYGFIVGDINISGADDIIGAYSTLNKSAYDVLQYLANISGSRWRARYVNSSTMAIDFYDPDTLPQAEDIEYTKEYWENNNIVDMTFNYGTRDYRNKQILLSDEVYANINYDETLISNGYSNTFTVQNNIGLVVSVIVNNEEKAVGTNNDKQMGIDADFYYTPGKNIIESNMIYPASTLIHLTYQPLVKGRQIVYNNSEVDRISRQTDTEGVIARYETRNDILSSDELEKIAQTYIEYKGKAEVILTLKTQNKDLYNIGEVVYFNAPIDELKQNYMVKTKQIEYVVINDIINLFYIYEMTSSFNSEKAINYFDNQRNKASGNIADGESITRNIDIETEVGIIWTEGSVSSASVTVTGDNLLNSALNSPFVE